MPPNFENCDFGDDDLDEKAEDESNVEMDFTDANHEQQIEDDQEHSSGGTKKKRKVTFANSNISFSGLYTHTQSSVAMPGTYSYVTSKNNTN